MMWIEIELDFTNLKLYSNLTKKLNKLFLVNPNLL